MLGDRGEIAAAATAAASSSSKSPNKSRAQLGSVVRAHSSGKSADQSVPLEEPTTNQLDSLDIGFVDDSAFDYTDENDLLYEWVCSTCTLINDPATFVCLTCESLRCQ